MDDALIHHVRTWRGNFTVPGLGAGNVRTGRWTRGQADRFLVLVDCDLVDPAWLVDQVVSGTLVMGPRGLDPAAGVPLQVPLALVQQQQAGLAGSVDVAALRAWTGGWSFYVRLETRQGTLFVNKDGQPCANFEVAAEELA